MEGLTLWFALLAAVDRIENPAPYEMSHFFYYDEQHKLHGVPLQNKVFVEVTTGSLTSLPFLALNAPDKFAAQLKKNPNVVSVTTIKSADRSGVMLLTKSKKEALEVLNEMVRGYNAYPVVIWEGVESIPLPEVVLQTTSPVTEILLRRRLNSLGKVTIESITNLGDNNYSVVFKDPKVPSNILVLANIVSEDTAWIKWCKPKFQPVIGNITAIMYVTTPAETNLGEMRQLNIVVDVFKQGIKLRTDLIPAMPPIQHPHQSIEDIWLDVNPPIIKEEKGFNKTTYTIAYKFRLFRPGSAIFSKFSLAYEDGKESKTIVVEMTGFQTNSVLNNTIDDIQLITKRNLLEEVISPEIAVPIKFPYFNLAGFVLLILGGVVALGKAGGVASAVAGNWWLAFRESHGKERLWKDLRRLANHLNRNNWNEDYHKVSKQMVKVLATFFAIHTPLSSDGCVNLEVAAIFRELEKLYQEKAIPNVKALSDALLLFYKNRSLDV